MRSAGLATAPPSRDLNIENAGMEKTQHLFYGVRLSH